MLIKKIYFNSAARTVHFVYEDETVSGPISTRIDLLRAFLVAKHKGEITSDSFSALVEELVVCIDLLPYYVGEQKMMVQSLTYNQEQGYLTQAEFELLNKKIQKF